MNILVTGGCGQLGMSLRDLSKGSEDRFIFSDLVSFPGLDTLFLDLTDSDAIGLVLDSEQVDLVVNCAAYTAVDKAEDDLKMASLVNEVAVSYLAIQCKRRSVPIIHISTDYIFDGMKNSAYSEFDHPSPLSAYGRTKLGGEQALISSGAPFMIIRTAWLYSPFGKNFVKTMLTLSGERGTLSVVSDQIGTPTYSYDLASLILKVISIGDKSVFCTSPSAPGDGIYNYTDEGVCSWYDFSFEIVSTAARMDREAGRLPRACKVLPCHSYEYKTKAVRPLFSLLDKTKVKEKFSIQIPHWTESLEKCMRILYTKA